MTDLLSSPFTPLTDDVSILGEGPTFHPRDGRLYWLDIKGQRLLSIATNGGDPRGWDLPDMVSAIAPARHHHFICARRKGFSFLDPQKAGWTLTPLLDIEADLPGNRLNDGKLDPFGGFWAGSMDNGEVARTGAWWRLAPDGKASRLEDRVMITNGPAFTEDGRTGYKVDSADQVIFSFTPTERGFENARVFRTFGKGEGYPDGILVDRENCLWAAFWGAGCVRRFAPDGALLATLEVPARQPTSVEIIGRQIFVTTASIGLTDTGPASFDGRLLGANLSVDIAPRERRIFDDSALLGSAAHP